MGDHTGPLCKEVSQAELTTDDRQIHVKLTVISYIVLGQCEDRLHTGCTDADKFGVLQ